MDTFRSGGKGGQNQNKVESGVRFTHLETGISAECREHRDQIRNKREAFRKLAERLVAYVLRNEVRERVPLAQETIRTYHAVDNRVKDHLSGLQQPFGHVL